MMKILVACLLSLILTALFFASLLVLSERPTVRYSGPWPYQTNFAALYADSGPVDIVFGGSSRFSPRLSHRGNAGQSGAAGRFSESQTCCHDRCSVSEPRVQHLIQNKR